MTSLKIEQDELASRVISEDDFATIRLVGGMDVSNNRFDPEKRVFGSCVLLSFETKEVIEHVAVMDRQEFPYIPGFLAFREAPVLMKAFQALKQKPDLLFIDGQGISHPRGLGIASHMGVLLDIPTIGVAKTILIGEPQGELGIDEGSSCPLVYHGKQVAMLFRSKKNCKPLIISIGHRVSLETAVSLVQKMCTGYRLPEPTRQAHLEANRCRRCLY